MAAVTTVVDGRIKFRESKKWKNRWCVLKKPSPVADHLQLVLYKDVSEASKLGGKPKAVYTVDSFFGLEAEICVDREQHVLAIICLKNVFLLAFELRESMIRFEIKIRQSLGEEHQFPVKVVKAPSSSKLPKDQLCLIIHGTRFCLTGQTPPKILMSWNVEDLRRFVARDDKFIFEAGTRCGKGSGLFAVLSEQANDIADIIHLASSGKMSNCHRKFKNRSSQIELGSHLISPLQSQSPSSSQPHHHYHNHCQQDAPVSKAPLQTALPATLNCCYQNQTGSAESEDWSWYKRHSVSVTDHRRISALREKSNVDNSNQLALSGIYDTPPNHDMDQARSQPEPTYDHPRSYLDQVVPLPPSASNNAALLPPALDYVNDDVVYAKIQMNGIDKEASEDWMSEAEAGKRQTVDNAITSVGQSDHGRLAAIACDTTLERLKKQEYDLQREMVLLDEMLQSCTVEDNSMEQGGSGSNGQNTSIAQPKAIPITKDDNIERRDSAMKQNSTGPEKVNADFGLYDELPSTNFSEDKENNSQDYSNVKDVPVPNSLLLSPKDFEIISGNVSVMKPRLLTQGGVIERKPRSLADRLNTSLPEATPLSPLFHAKLNSIPQTSRLNAPLPYVNLSGYDDDGTNHVHLPGSADCPPTVTRGSSFHSLNTSYSCDGDAPSTSWSAQGGSSTSLHLPAAVSSLTNLNQHHHHLDSSPRRLQSRQSLDSATARLRNNNRAIDHFKLKQAIEGLSFANAAASPTKNQREVLIVRMDSATDVSSKKNDSSTTSSVHSLSFDTNEGMKNKSEIVNLLTVDSGCLSSGTEKEEIYVNLPVVKEGSPPPPPLPPKGPALLKKLQTSSPMSSPPSQQQQTRSAMAQQQDRLYGYDNEPMSTSTQSRKKDIPEEPNSNYLEMGSPKTSHKYSVTTVPKVTPRQAGVMPKLNKTLAKIPKGRDDYMDMGVVDLPPTSENLKYEEDDEIYLDVDETFKHSDLYVSERNRSENREEYVPVTVLPGKRESTYIEMAQVVPQKSTVVQNLETLHAYVSKKLGGSETALNIKASPGVAVVNPTASPSHPPLPRSLKIRHNSDSGPPKRASANLDSILSNSSSSCNAKPGKSPMKIYTRMKASSEQPRSPSPNGADRPAPFTNLLEFTKRMADGKSTYVNTCVNSDNILVPHDFVPLPEPVTKEGFLARLKRRGSRDKGTPEKPSSNTGCNSVKNRSGFLERSMSEHESPKCLRRDDKNSASSSRLKLGRRRSSSFPNRLSYHESNTDNSLTPESSQLAADSFSSVSPGSCKAKPFWKKDPSQNESSSSIQDNSDDSDISPLLKHGRSSVVNSITTLHVQQDIKQPYVKDLVYTSTSKCNKSTHTQSQFSSSNSPSLSKTDDEKMIEIFQRHHQQRSQSLPESHQDNHYLYNNYKTPDRSTGTSSSCSSSTNDGIYFNASSLENVDGPSDNGRCASFHKTMGTAGEEYCNVTPSPPPRPPTTLCVNVGVNTHATTTTDAPPSLPPKVKSYQALLSPVYESAPALPMAVDRSCDTTIDDDLNTSSATWQSERDTEEDYFSDQYVELKGVDDAGGGGEEDQLGFRQLNSSTVNSKAGRESIPSTSSSSDSKEVNPISAEYTTISIPIMHHLTNGVDVSDREENDATLPPSPTTSSLLITNSLIVEQSSISFDDNTDIVNGCCYNPAKSVLRPRAGREYIVLKRILAPDTTSLVSGPSSAGLVSHSPSLSHVFEYNDHHCSKSHRHHHNQHHHHHHPHHLHHHHHNQPISSCTSLSVCSQRTTPQRSPSFSSSTNGIAQSQNSLLHEPLVDKDHSSHRPSSTTPQLPTQKPVLRTTQDISITTHSTPSPSPKTPSSSCIQLPHTHCNYSSPKTKNTSTSNCLLQSAVAEEDNIFFPIDMTYKASSPLPPPVRRHGTSGSDSSHHQQPIYVNQHFVDMHNSQSQSSGSRTNSTCSSQANSSPVRSYIQTHRSLLQDSFPSPPPNLRHTSDSNSLGRKVRMRSRHSESDAGFAVMDRLSKSFTLPSNHHHHRPSLTLPPTINVHRSHSDSKRADHLQSRQSVSQSHIHGKEFDKFADSSIIARRRLKHAHPNGERLSPPPVAIREVTSESSPNLQIPSVNLRSSGYKNLAGFGATSSNPSSNNVSPACHSANGLAESQPSTFPERQNDGHVISNSPPPLPIRQRFVSTPSTISPPLTPFMGASSDISDSPPPYNAPPPPDFHRSESYLTPTSSEDEQELNYIEIDMSTKPCQVEEPPLPLSFSRRSKRARQQRKLAKLRYAEIDHTATKALQETGQEHAQTRRSGGISSKSGSSLSRMNSAPISKNHKPLTVRERKHSTGSVESL